MDQLVSETHMFMCQVCDCSWLLGNETSLIQVHLKHVIIYIVVVVVVVVVVQTDRLQYA